MSISQIPPVLTSQTPHLPPTTPPALIADLQLKIHKYADFLASPALTSTLSEFIIAGYHTDGSPFPGPRFKTPTAIYEYLGPSGTYAVIYSGADPVACASARPWVGDFEGFFPDDEKDSGWEISTVTTKKGWYKLGLVGRCIEALREEVGRIEVERSNREGSGESEVGFRFWLHCIEEINGLYWRRRGFRLVRQYEKPDGIHGANGHFTLLVMVEDLGAMQKCETVA